MSIWTERAQLPADFASDANLTHEWATRWRIPLVRTPITRWKYEVALVVPPAEPDPYDPWRATWPTEPEAAVIGSLIDFRMTWYNERWQAKMREWPLDVDSGTNTLVLLKRETCWSYRRASFNDAMTWPAWNNAEQVALYPPTKAGLVAIIANAWGGITRYNSDEPNDLGRWIADRPEVWS